MIDSSQKDPLQDNVKELEGSLTSAQVMERHLNEDLDKVEVNRKDKQIAAEIMIDAQSGDLVQS